MCDTYTRREIISIRNGSYYVPHLSIQNATGFRVLKVVCGNNFSNVIAGLNNVFQWLDNAGNPRTANIPTGRYDYSSLAVAFQTACNAVGAETFTVTYDVNTKKYNINTNLAITPQWVSGSLSSTNISRIMGYYNDTAGNETFSVNHTSDYPAQLVPSHFLLKSKMLGSGRKSAGGGGGTQIGSKDITNSPQFYINVLPNQVDGSLSTFVYRAPDNDTEVFQFNAPRQMNEIDFTVIHPYYPDMSEALMQRFYSPYEEITFEVEFICNYRYK